MPNCFILIIYGVQMFCLYYIHHTISLEKGIKNKPDYNNYYYYYFNIGWCSDNMGIAAAQVVACLTTHQVTPPGS